MPAIAAPTPAASPAPAPAPAASPSPAPGSSPPSAPAPDTSGDDNPYAELDRLNAEDEKPRTPARDPKGKFVKPEAKPEPKPEAKPGQVKPTGTEQQPKPEVKPAGGEQAPARTAELRARYDEFKAKVADLEPKLTAAQARIAELEAATASAKPDTAKMEALQKENEALRDEIRYVNYTKHPDFVTKHQKPYQEAWNKAVSEITQLTIETEGGKTRKGTANDLLSLAQAPLDQIDELAEEWFGKAAPRVIRHVEKVRELAEAQEAALENARKDAEEHEKTTAEQRKTQDAAVAKAYSEANTDLVKKYPRWFAPMEGDAPGNELLQKGFAYADSVFGPNGNLTGEQKARRLAVIRSKAANHDRLAARLKASSARIAELEKALAEYENSEPGSGDARSTDGSSGKGFIEDANAELDALDKK